MRIGVTDHHAGSGQTKFGNERMVHPFTVVVERSDPLTTAPLAEVVYHLRESDIAKRRVTPGDNANPLGIEHPLRPSGLHLLYREGRGDVVGHGEIDSNGNDLADPHLFAPRGSGNYFLANGTAGHLCNSVRRSRQDKAS